MAEKEYDIGVIAETNYISEQSYPEENRYVFAYTITLTNNGLIAATLLRRHWLITDANCKVQEVRGEGVIGEQPHILPGESFRYTSAAVLETPVGCMQGSYQMIADDGVEFDAAIPVFNLSTPNTLH
ncbi:MAG: Co2+/Mg2+ efflux protein ApaG [Proteobacteria bacterium]|nr:Co2+/Mg2+ efflux protein ApaG [Pseudomonadota bacterium]